MVTLIAFGPSDQQLSLMTWTIIQIPFLSINLLYWPGFIYERSRGISKKARAAINVTFA
jgi:hypothetical protein